MELRPGYKHSDVGVIPDDWSPDYIESFAVITTGGKNTQDRIEDGQYPFFVRSQTVERINSYSFDGEAVLTAGDGVGTGKVFHYINGKFDVHQRVYRISNFAEHVNGYFFYLCFSTHFYHRIMQMTAKSSVDSVRRDMISRMQIALPPTETEQRAIAQALSDVDSLLATLDQVIAKKRNLKQAVMQQLLTGKTRLPGFSGAWEVTDFGGIVEKFVGGGTPSRANKAYWGCDIPWVTVKDFSSFKPRESQEYITKIGLINSASNLIPKGTLITSTRMALGKAVVYEIDVAINQDLKALLFRQEIDVTFMRHWFSFFEKTIDDLGGGSTVKGISIVELKRLRIFLPKENEQISIASVLSDMDAELSVLESRHNKTRNIKQAMMQELLTGKTRLVSNKVQPIEEKAR